MNSFKNTLDFSGSNIVDFNCVESRLTLGFSNVIEWDVESGAGVVNVVNINCCAVDCPSDIKLNNNVQVVQEIQEIRLCSDEVQYINYLPIDSKRLEEINRIEIQIINGEKWLIHGSDFEMNFSNGSGGQRP